MTAYRGNYIACQWLLEHGGADIVEAADNGQTFWDTLVYRLSRRHRSDEAVAEVTALLRVMVLKRATSADLVGQPIFAQVVEEGARLRAALPAYLVRRRTLLDVHYPLIPPLLALVYDYAELTTEELWATGLGAAP
jgi:hypothetical protein